MNPIYLGVDMAGKENTWIAALSLVESKLEMVFRPHTTSLKEILEYCEAYDVVAVAIDAQLTAALTNENGFRSSDDYLREKLLPKNCRNWVASINSLMAVPVRGRMLADALSPVVGTLLETHPRACLLFGLGESFGVEIRNYKKGPLQGEYLENLINEWCKKFQIAQYEHTYIQDGVLQDGALDSLVCATVAYLYHHAPEKLFHLRDSAGDKIGRGPFYVVGQVIE